MLRDRPFPLWWTNYDGEDRDGAALNVLRRLPAAVGAPFGAGQMPTLRLSFKKL